MVQQSKGGLSGSICHPFWSLSEHPSHVLGSLSSYKPCCGHYLPLAGKAEMPVICFSSFTPSLALLQLEFKCII